MIRRITVRGTVDFEAVFEVDVGLRPNYGKDWNERAMEKIELLFASEMLGLDPLPKGVKRDGVKFVSLGKLNIS